VKFAMPICEDIWFPEVIQSLKMQGADVLLVSNASPFSYKKINERMEIVRQRFQETHLPIVYCNQVLCQDGILYDGTSFVFDGKNTIFASSFKEEILEVTLRDGHFAGNSIARGLLQSNQELTFNALVFGLKEYIITSGFKKVVIGLSGGADSALVLVLAVRALGAENVKAVLMPSRFTSKESIDDAKQLALNTQVKLEEISIEKPLQAFTEILDLRGLSFENIQARIRGNILMAISNQENSLVLTTGNKSEVAVGYCTLYGDMCGAYNPIKDLYKTEVFAVMHYINQAEIAKIPVNIITKAPSAELRENQKDSDSLPDYEILDKILFELIENKKLPEEITGFDEAMVKRVSHLLLISEYKRRQSAPGTKLSSQSFEPTEWRRNIIY
jgi:NAD+ synthase